MPVAAIMDWPGQACSQPHQWVAVCIRYDRNLPRKTPHRARPCQHLRADPWRLLEERRVSQPLTLQIRKIISILEPSECSRSAELLYEPSGLARSVETGAVANGRAPRDAGVSRRRPSAATEEW